MINQRRGLFIVLEGLDRSGKSTQVKLLSQKLQAKSLQFPDRNTNLGGVISAYLKGQVEMKDEAIHLLFSANRWERCIEINKLLEQGTHVVCDRYAYSGVAFSAAKGLSLEWCKSTDRGLPEPDLTIFLKAPQQVLAGRGEFGKERYETNKFQSKVQEVFDKLIESEKMKVIACDQNQEEVFNDIMEIIETKLDKELKPVGQLWMQQ